MEIFSAFGLSASAGLNAYLPLLIVSSAANLSHLVNRLFGWHWNLFELNPPFDVIGTWWVWLILLVLTLIEMGVDKVPAADTANDIIGTIVRPTAGAILFAASAGNIMDISPALAIGLGLVTAGSVHGVKTIARPAVTVTTAGMGNPVISTVEDIVALFTSILAILLPGVIAIFALFGVIIFLMWRIRRLKRKHQQAQQQLPAA